MPLLNGCFIKKPITPAGVAPTHAVATVRDDRCHIDCFVVETHRAQCGASVMNVTVTGAMYFLLLRDKIFARR